VAIGYVIDYEKYSREPSAAGIKIAFSYELGGVDGT
jgi:hypothetical protein